MTVQLGETLHIVIGGAVEEGIVDMTFLAAESRLVGQGFECSGLRHRVGHVEIRGGAAKAAALLSLSMSALAVSPGSRKCTWSSITRHNKTPRGIDCLVETATRCFFAIINMCYLFAIDNEVSSECLSSLTIVPFLINVFIPAYSFFSGMVGRARSLGVGAGAASGAGWADTAGAPGCISRVPFMICSFS